MPPYELAHRPQQCPHPAPYTDFSSNEPQMRSLNTTIRSRIRAILVAHGPQTCSDLVRIMGLDPKNCKRTIHSILKEMETEGILGATMKGKLRDLWFIYSDQIRKRDKIRAVFM